jgi:hypothetical protein
MMIVMPNTNHSSITACQYYKKPIGNGITVPSRDEKYVHFPALGEWN